jgi:hypothetical protein
MKKKLKAIIYEVFIGDIRRHIRKDISSMRASIGQELRYDNDRMVRELEDKYDHEVTSLRFDLEALRKELRDTLKNMTLLQEHLNNAIAQKESQKPGPTAVPTQGRTA